MSGVRVRAGGLLTQPGWILLKVPLMVWSFGSTSNFLTFFRLFGDLLFIRNVCNRLKDLYGYWDLLPKQIVVLIG